MSKDYAEILLQAVDTLYNKRLESINFDVTDSATIIEVQNADEGKYLVSTKTAKYVAYSVNTRYRVGDSVYVTIPNGDYDKQKIIIGKQVDGNSTPFVYTFPFDTIVNVSENLISNTTQTQGGLIANYYYDYTDEQIQQIMLDETQSKRIQKKIWERDFTKENLVGFTRLGLQAQFRSWLNPWKTINGDYGLKLVLSYKTQNCDVYTRNYTETLNRLSNILNKGYANSLNYFLELQNLNQIAIENGTFGTQAYYDSLENLQSIYNDQSGQMDSDWNWILNSSLLTLSDEERVKYPTKDLIENVLIPRAEESLNALQGTYTLFFNCTEFYGDPYNFNTYFQQENVYDISSLNENAQIIKMELYFYQAPGTFFGQDKNPIPYSEEGPFGNDDLPANLFVKDPYICLGFGVGEFKEDDVSLYTVGSLAYQYQESEDNSYLNRTLQLRWVHKYDDGTIAEVKNVANTGLPELLYEIRWYRYQRGAAASDPYCGDSWVRIPRSNAQSFTYEAVGDDALDVKKSEEMFKAIIILFKIDSDGKKYDSDIYRSNTLTFTNGDYVVNEEIIEQLTGLYLKCNDNSEGNYFVYGQSGTIQEQSDAFQLRQLHCCFKPSGGTGSILTGATSLYWRIPAVNSMIELADMYQSPSDYISGATNRDINTVEWTLAPSFTINERGKEIQAYEEKTIGLNHGQVNSGIVYHITWSGVCYDSNTNEYIIGFKGDPDFGYFINPALCYRIRASYEPSRTNNTVTCQVERNGVVYSASQTFRFGPAGTNGSAYTLVVNFDNENSSHVLTQDLEEQIYVSAVLLDTDKHEVNDFQGHYVWSWLPQTKRHVNEENDEITQTLEEFSSERINNDYVTILQDAQFGRNDRISLVHSDDVDLTETLFYLKCELVDFNSFDLEVVTPVAVRTDKKYLKTEGPETVCYRSSGYPYFHRVGYQLQEWNSDAAGWSSIQDINWDIYNINNELENFIGQVTEDTNELQPCGIYMKNAQQYGVVAMDSSDNILWIQPVYCFLNEYPSSTLNAWDGKTIEINEEEGTILASAISAGKKNSDNTFSGIMLGDWSNTDTSSEITEQTGLYGMNHNEMSYAFMENGTGFIGKSGMGRILFDGTESVIQSEAYQQNAGGMHIDLDDGIIDIQGTKKLNVTERYIGEHDSDGKSLDGKGVKKIVNTYQKSGSQVVIQSESPYLSIKTENYVGAPTQGSEILHIGSDDYFLQSDDWHEDTDLSEAYVLVDKNTVNENNYMDYYVVDENNPAYELDRERELIRDKYYIKQGNNYVDSINNEQFKVVEYEPNEYYTEYKLSTSNVYDKNKKYYSFNQSTDVFTEYDMFENHYVSNTYYYRTNTGKMLAKGLYDEHAIYYKLNDDNTFTEVNLISYGIYEPNIYYYYDQVNSTYVLADSEAPLENVVYYSRDILYPVYEEVNLGSPIYNISDKYVLHTGGEQLYTGTYDPTLRYFKYTDGRYDEVILTVPTEYAIDSETQYCVYNPIDGTYVVVPYNSIQGGSVYYLRELTGYELDENEQQVPVYSYTLVGMLYVSGYYYTVEETSYVLNGNEPYVEGRDYYKLENNEYILLNADDYINAPDAFRDAQLDGILYLQAYTETNLPWSYNRDYGITFYYYRSGMYHVIENEAQYNSYIPYIQTYYRNTAAWNRNLTYYVHKEAPGEDFDIYEYNSIGKQYIVLYEPDVYYINYVPGNNNVEYYYDTKLNLTNEEFEQEVEAIQDGSKKAYLTYIEDLYDNNNENDEASLSKFYKYEVDNETQKESFYVVNSAKELVKIYYNNYQPNIYYNYIQGKNNIDDNNKYKGDTFYSGYTYYDVNGNLVFFYEPEKYYYQLPNYIQLDVYDSNINRNYYKKGKFSGTKIDIKTGKITSYNLSLTGYHNSPLDSYPRNIVISSIADTYPLKIGTQEDETFKVSWDGSLYSTAGEIGGWKISPNSLSYGILGQSESVFLQPGGTSDATIAGQTQKDWVITAGSTFGVTKDGRMYSTSGKIGSWDVRETFLASGLNESDWTADTWLFSTDQTAERSVVFISDGTLSFTDQYTKQWRLLIGNVYNFGVNKNGEVIARKKRIPNNALFIDGNQVTIKEVTIPVSFDVKAVGGYVYAGKDYGVTGGYPLISLNLSAATCGALGGRIALLHNPDQVAAAINAGLSTTDNINVTLNSFNYDLYVQLPYEYDKYVWSDTAGGYKTYITQVVKGKILSGINGLAIEDLSSWYLLNSSNNKYGLVQNGNTWSPGKDWNKVKLLGHNIEPKNVYIDGLTVMDNYS